MLKLICELEYKENVQIFLFCVQCVWGVKMKEETDKKRHRNAV